jgi:glycosyltransferase involved in cell wall biosynthesis
MEKHLIDSGLSAYNMTQIPNWADGVQIESVYEADNEFLNRHGLKGRFIAMYSGHLGTVHEFTTILGMIRRTQSYSDVSFCFVGDGPQKRCLVDTVRREALQHVLFLPYETKERLRFSLSAADIHLVSLRGEMAGLSVPSKLYGIMAAGRPVIFIGPKESESAMVIRKAECGHVINPGDVDGGVSALMTYYRHREEIGRQGQAARRYFERHYERTTATERFLEVLTAHR